MPLETATFINQLDAANPLGSDPISAGDDHLRLIKSAVKATFPNITGAVTKSHTEINTAVDQAAAALSRAGGTMTGPLVLQGNASSALQAVPFQQLQAMYPVGSIYMNATNSANPEVLFGFGTWVAFGAGRMPVGFNAADPLFDTAEETGGSKDAIVVSHTHAATSVVTDPGHTHNLKGGFASVSDFVGGSGNDYGVGVGSDLGSEYQVVSNTTGITVTTTNASTGSSGTNANLPPYITVYMWKRTA